MFMRRSFILAALLAVSLPSWAASKTYTLDPNHTNVLASWSHFGFSTPSINFGQVDGTLVYDQEHPNQSSVHARLPIAGIDGLAQDFASHLQGKDWFNAEKYPDAHFHSTQVKQLGPGHLQITGTLTIKDIAKPVVLDVTLNKTDVHPMTKKAAIGFNATTTIKRSDFGLGAYVPAVSDEVQLRITTEAQDANEGK